MARATHDEIAALEALVGILEEAQVALRKTGEESADITDWIGKFRLAIDGAVDVIPNINEINDAFTRLEAGIAGVVRMGDSLGNMSLGDAARGYNLSRKETAPFETKLINDFGKEINALDSSKLREVAVELEKISADDWSVKEIRNFAKEMENLKDVQSPVFDKDKKELVADLRDALRQLGEEVETIEVEVKGVDVANEKVKDLEASITTLSEADLSKISKQYSELTSVSSFPVENIKSFVENLEKLSKTDPENATRVVEGLVKSLETLRKSGEVTGSVKELGDALSKLSDESLTEISEEFNALKDSNFPIENIKSFAKILSDFEVKEGSGETIKQLEVAFKTITDTSQLSTKQIKELGQNLSELEGIDLERLVVAVSSIAGGGFDPESIKAYADAIKDIQSKSELSEGGLKEINALDEALKSIGRDQALPFKDLVTDLNTSGVSASQFTKELDHLSQQLNRASREDIKEFVLELQFLKDNLGGLGLSTDGIDKIVEHFVNLGTIESPAKFFEELSQLGLPDEEVKKFAESFLTLRANSGEIDIAREKLEAFGVPTGSIDKLIQRLVKIPELFTGMRVGISGTSADFENLKIKFTNTADEADGFTVKLNRADRSIADIAETAKKSRSEVVNFARALAEGGASTDAIAELTAEAFGDKKGGGFGATKFRPLNWKDLEDGAKSFETTLTNSENGTQRFKVELTELGEIMREVGAVAGKSELRQFAEGLKAAGAPRAVRRKVVDDSSATGVEGLSSVRVTELDGDITRLTGNLQLGGGILKAYTLYWDKFGKVITELPVKDTTVSLQDFTDTLSDRVGAIDNVTKLVDKYGFKLSDLKGLTTEASTGLTRLEFAMKSQGGATEKLTLHVTEFGKVLTDTQKRFRTFAGGIARNIGESFKWAVAITAVYGPLRKLQDLVQISIDNEAKLADIGVVLGKNTSELQDIFASAAAAAQATGESLNGVIEGYSLAYRATGNIVNQTERAAVANQLLIDSLVLSKLSTLDQAHAMDTLVAGLLQAGYSLDEGALLLNKWVAVSKAANVTVDTLATSFAIMATAGEGVGLSFDEINAIVAIVAAKTELSATQAGNAVRAFVSGFQTKNAREELAKFGIAVEDLNGDARNFMTVMNDIKELMDAGLIDESELNRIGTMLGGRGARRGAQFTTFLKSLDDVQGLVTVSAEAQGDAYDALDVKMDTVETSITNLASQFQVLANAVGTEGGVLSLLKGLLDVLNDITAAATSFVGVMGKAAPFLAVAGGLYGYGKYGSQRLGAAPGQFGGFVAGAIGRTSYGQQPQGGGGQMALPGFGVQGAATGNTMAKAWGLKAQQYAPLLGTLAVQGMMAAINVRDKDWDGLGAQIAGGILGAPFGPIGSIIGSTIAESVVNGLQAAGNSGELDNVFAGALRDDEDEEEDDDPSLTRQQRLLKEEKRLNEELRDIVGGEWAAGVGLFQAKADNFLLGLANMPKKWKDDLEAPEFIGEILTQIIGGYDTGGVKGARQAAAPLPFPGFGPYDTDEGIEKRIADARVLLGLIKENNASRASLAEGKEPEGTVLDTELTRNMEKYGDLLKDEINVAQDEFNTQLIEGDLTLRQYRESMERMGSEGEAIIQVFGVMNDILGDSEETLLLILDVMSKTTAEENNIITNLTSGIGDLMQQISDAEAEGDVELVSIKTDELERAYLEIESIFSQIRNAQREPLIQLDSAVDLDTRSLEDHNRVIVESMRLLEEQLQESIRLGLVPSDTTIDEILATYDVIKVMIGGKIAEIMQIPTDIYAEAQANLAIPGKIAPPVDAERGLQVKEVDQTKAAFLAAYNKQFAELKASFGDLYQGDFSTVGIIFSDGVDVLHLDNLSMQLAMNDLIDVSQKQLEGVYNLPTDSSFYVPFQGYKLGFGEGGGGGGLDAAATDLSGSAQELRLAASELRSAAMSEQRITHGENVGKRYFEGEVKPQPQISREAYALRQQGKQDDYSERFRFERTQQWLNDERPGGQQEDDFTLPEKLIRELFRMFFGAPDLKALLEVPQDFYDRIAQAIVSAQDASPSPLEGEKAISEYQQQLMKDLEDPGGPPANRLIFEGSTAGPPAQDTFLPQAGAEQAGVIVEETQSLSGTIVEALQGLAVSIVEALLSGGGIPGVGGGLGSGPGLDFDTSVTKFDNAVGSFESFVGKPLGPAAPAPDARLRPPISSALEQGGADSFEPDLRTAGDIGQQILKWITDLFSGLGMSGATGTGDGAGIGPEFNFSKLDSATTKLDNFASVLQAQQQFTALGPAAPFGGTTDLSTEFAGMLDLLSQKISNLSGFTTNLKISSVSTTNLIVDGRTLAQVIKPYLYSDMIRFEDSSSTVTKNIVV